jgi:signal transduction histidine kinase
VFKATLSVRARILAIALIPSIALLVIGVSAAGYLVAQGIQAKNWSAEVARGTTPGIQFSETVQEERRLTLLKLAGDQESAAALAAQRARVDGALEALNAAGNVLRDLNPVAMKDAASAFDALFKQVAATRQQIDAGALSPQDAYTFYNQLLSVVSIGMQGVARYAPDAGTAFEEGTAAGLFQVAEAMSRGNALAAAAVSQGGLTADQLQDYSRQVGSYHTQLENLIPSLTPQEQAQYKTLVTSPPWQQLSAMETALIQRGVTSPTTRNTAALPMSVPDWQNAATQVNNTLLGLWQSHNNYSEQFATASGDRTETNSLWGGAGVLIISIAAFLVALRMSNRLIGRLKRLRGETLAMADDRLPNIMNRLRDGESVDLDAEVSPLNHGNDEIGQVADAFNRAQYAAVMAAVIEAKTREGVNAVFLNIAHRSQVVVHRQLEILDKAEYEQEDPGQLEMLFQLDHLATRERRNAENLIILGGEQPGRQWRNPVPLVELVRSAVAETEDYARVRTARLPEVSIVGNVVADLIHLLAELVDNATSFSPPESRVEVSGNVVGKGVVVEITDQGLGMPEEEIERINKTLREPPDFSVTTLSSDSRLGMFVVSQLAARNGATVRLLESDYGGIRVIVLIPSSLLAAAVPTAEPSPATDAATTMARRRRTTVPAEDRLPSRVERANAVGKNTVVVSWPTEEPAAPETAERPPLPSRNARQEPNRETAARERISEPAAARARPPGQEPPARSRPEQRPPADDRPVLPRRRRQANLAPQLARSAPPAAPEPDNGNGSANGPGHARQDRARSADQARDLFSAIETGTRQGRQARPDPEPTTRMPDGRDEREGHDF